MPVSAAPRRCSRAPGAATRLSPGSVYGPAASIRVPRPCCGGPVLVDGQRRQDPGWRRHRADQGQPDRLRRPQGALRWPASQHLGDRWRRRHLRGNLVAQHAGFGGLLRVEHEDARPCLRAIGRASLPRRDRARPRPRTGSSSRHRPSRKCGRRRQRVSTEFRNSRNILFANYHGYRVTRSIKPMERR
jgi:hypothetical protein